MSLELQILDHKIQYGTIICKYNTNQYVWNQTLSQKFVNQPSNPGTSANQAFGILHTPQSPSLNKQEFLSNFVI